MKIAVIVILCAVQLFNFFLDFLCYKNRNAPVPDNVSDIYDHDAYVKQNSYTMEKLRLSIIASAVYLVLTVFYLVFNIHSRLFDFFGAVSSDIFVKNLLMFGVTVFVWLIIKTVFDAIEKFHIDGKFGFNKTKVKTFVTDSIIKTVFFGLLLAGLLYLDTNIDLSQNPSDIYLVILLVLAIIIGVPLLAPLFMRIFNKFTPITDDELKNKIDELAKKTNYPVKKIYVINASKRSTKLNAFFTGVGKSKTIALFDTLIEKMTDDEIVAVLAHEIGHSKKKHLLFNLFFNLFVISLVVFVLSVAIGGQNLSAAFGFSSSNSAFSVYLLLIAFEPLLLMINIPLKLVSRRFEFAADDFAKQQTDANNMISALKKIARENYASLTPHPFVVMLTYSHPPLSQRIAALENPE